MASRASPSRSRSRPSSSNCCGSWVCRFFALRLCPLRRLAMHRVVGDIRPRYVIIENVRALVGNGLDRVLCDLASIGYDAEWADISAEQFGAEHGRARVWIVAYPNGVNGSECPRVGAEQNRAAAIFPTDDRQRTRVRLQAARATIGSDDGLSAGVYEDRVRGIGLSIFVPIAEFIFRRIIDSGEIHKGVS